MRAVEVLAPVGGPEQLLAAVRSGADAVYLGSRGFNARRNAANFDGDGLADAVAYCHGRGVKVHVTLNTLILDGERQRLLDELALIAASGADAVIVQDLGVAALVRQCCPTLVMHASTQLSVHNVAGALLMKELGFTRLVLARELSLAEITQIKQKSGLEIEVFVHGALCMSMSGNCYLSALLGERSGNRGLCAQPCRLNFRSGNREYALSLKDLSAVEQIGALAEAGVDSLKIEGRMKRPEYVAAAVTACRRVLAGEPPNLEELQAVFSRSGFTNGYLTGQREVSMFGYRRREDVTAAAGVLDSLAAGYRNEAQRLPLTMQFTLRADCPARLVAGDGRHTVTVTGGVPQLAQTRPTDLALVRRGLEKLGGTPFYLEQLTAELDEGLMLPVSAMNALRKEAAEQLLALAAQTKPHAFAYPEEDFTSTGAGSSTPQLWVRLERVTQLTEPVKNCGALITLPLNELYSHQELLAALGDQLAAELPMLVFPDDEAATEGRLTQLRQAGLTAVVAGSQGALFLARRAGLSVIGDATLNILNSTALGEYERMGLTAATVSIESTMQGAKQLQGRIPVGVLGYGYLPVMTFRNCPARTEAGCAGCTGRRDITDRQNNDFPLLCRNKRYSQLLNPVPLYLGDRQEVLRGLSFVTLYFTVETARQVNELLELWNSGSSYPGKRTGGLYFRELL
ncbi:MAG: DUF3656 domain-containing protein [Angelakisella sp.]